MGNLNLFPTIVGTARIREASTNGVFFDIECATNISSSIDTTETIELSCGNGDSVMLEKPKATITMNAIKTKNVNLMAQLYNLAVVSTASGSKTITNSAQTFDSNGKIEMLERSSDALGITTIIVKSASTGGTTYTVSTDYTVSIVDGRTIITRSGSSTIPAGATVYVSGSYNTNISEEIELKRMQRVKKQFSLEIFGKAEGTNKFTTIYASPVIINSTYLLEMKDQFRDGQAKGAELTFELLDLGSLKIKDQNI